MESFGAYLRSLRDEKGKTLEDIAESTKIAVSNLDFLEKDRFDLLPPRVFVKGFIRSYVQELGLPPEEPLAKFEEFTKQGELADYDEELTMFKQMPESSGSFITSKWFTVALTAAGLLSLGILILTGAGRLYWWISSARSDKPAATVIQSGEPAVTTRGQFEAGSKKAVFGEAPRKTTGKRILEVKALSNAYIRVEPDSGPAEELVMAPGDIQVFTANESFQVLTGNAGGIRLRYDGRELPVLGTENQTLTLTLP